MLRKLSEMTGRTLKARDGDIGEIRAYYFDDRQWNLRYLVVQTGNWYDSREVIIAPESFTAIDWASNEFPVSLTREQVKGAPGANADEPVDRQEEERIVRYFGWQEYWNLRQLTRRTLAAEDAGRRTTVAEDTRENPHLFSTREVFGYTLRAADGELGTLQDFIVDDTSWAIRYAVIDTGTFLSAGKVLLPPEWIQSINWEDADISVALSREKIRNAPPYDPELHVTRSLEERLCAYYGLPKYWQR